MRKILMLAKYSISEALVLMQKPCYNTADRFTENGPLRNIAQLWKLFSYITIRILKISLLLSTHFKAFLFTGLLDLIKAQCL